MSVTMYWEFDTPDYQKKDIRLLDVVEMHWSPIESKNICQGPANSSGFAWRPYDLVGFWVIPSA